MNDQPVTTTFAAPSSDLPEQQAQPPQPIAAVRTQPLTLSEERTWAMLAHLSGLLAVAGPLVVLLMQKDRSLTAAREARESLNFQLTVALAFLTTTVLGMVLTFVVVGVFLMMLAPLVLLAGAALSIAGAVVAHRTETYRYPFAIRFVR